MIQIIAKLDEVLCHILNMSWLYHFNYNWKVWLMWFHKKHLNIFSIQMNIDVSQKKIVKKLLSFERWKELCWKPLYQNSFYMFIKMLDEIKEKLPPKYTQKKKDIFLPKTTPHSVLSPNNVLQNWLERPNKHHKSSDKYKNNLFQNPTTHYDFKIQGLISNFKSP